MSCIYKPTWVANTVIARSRSESRNDLTPLKLQKLIYCAHGWTLAVLDKPAIGERFEAWPYGPVVTSLYHQFKGYGQDPVESFAVDFDPETGESQPFVVASDKTEFHQVFEAVWERYKNYSGLELSSMTHADGTPWSLARHRGDQYLDDGEITAHFRHLASPAVN